MREEVKACFREFIETAENSTDAKLVARNLGRLDILVSNFGVFVVPKSIQKKTWLGKTYEAKEDYNTALLRKAKEMLADSDKYQDAFDAFDVLVFRINDLEDGIRTWADVRMKDFSDNQYGKGELKKLL